MTGVAWHPSGDLIATTTSDDRCIIWNPHTAEKITAATDDQFNDLLTRTIATDPIPVER